MPLIMHQHAPYAAASTDYVSDTFSTVSADMNGRTPAPTTAGHNWVEQMRNWATDGSKAAMTEAAYGEVVVDSTAGNCTVTTVATKKVGSGDAWGGLIVRNIGVDDCLLVILQTTGTDRMILSDFAVGDITSTNTGTLSTGTPYEIKAVLLNDNVKCYLDGVQLIDYTMSGAQYARFTTAKTSHGVGCSSGDAWSFDSFLVAP